MTRPWPPKTCHRCGERLYSFKAKLRHQNADECQQRMTQKRRDAAAASIEAGPAWERKS